jgi:hypothetical protein
MSGPSQSFKFNTCNSIWLRIQIVKLFMYVFFLIILLLRLTEVQTTPHLPPPPFASQHFAVSNIGGEPKCRVFS